MSNICNAFNNAVTFLPDGKVAPCCIIKGYSTDISELEKPVRFVELRENFPGPGCNSCIEYNHYNEFFDDFSGNPAQIEYIDFRNNNLCNLKCRHCGPGASSSWAKELGKDTVFVNTNVDLYIDKLLTDNVQQIYFAGGEPLINPDHWALLDKLIERNLSKNISLTYSTNLSTLEFKGLSAVEYWEHFEHVHVLASIDGTEKSFEYLRSGADWLRFDANLDCVLCSKSRNVSVTLSMTLSVLSVWFLKDVIQYAKTKNLRIALTQLTDPHYFTLNVLPDEYVDTVVSLLQECAQLEPLLADKLSMAAETARNNDDQGSFVHMIATVLLADKIRDENLFDLLPFTDYATKKVFKNQ